MSLSLPFTQDLGHVTLRPSLSLPVQFSLVWLSMSLSLPFKQDLGYVTLKASLFLPVQFSFGLAFHVVIVALHT